MIRLLIIILSFNSCVTIYNKKEFTYYKDSNASTVNLLNTNGYYFCLDSFYIFYNYKIAGSPNYLKPQKDIWTKDSILAYGIKTIILYKDGRTLVGYNSISTGVEYNLNTVTGENTFEAAKANFQNNKRFELKRNFKNKKYGIWDWGIYKFDKDTIKIQYFYNHYGNYDLIELQGIVTDTNHFRLVHWKNISAKKNNSKVINRLFTFERYEHKPDSTNNYLDRLIQRIKN